MKKVTEFIKTNSFILIISWLFILSLAFRVFQLDHFISYHQDQVRDLFYIREHFENGKIILLGPKASVGDFFLPPFWYYLMSFAYLFSKSPLSPAFLTAILSSITTVVIYIFVNKFFSKKFAFISAVIYALSPLSIEYSRFAWNPNPIPLFTILTLFFLYRFLFDNNNKSFYYGAIAANLAFQLHYQGMVILVFYFLVNILYRKMNFKIFIRYVLLNILLISPFLLYEIKNGFTNISGIINFLINTQAAAKLKLFGIPFFIKFIVKDFSLFLSRVLLFKNQLIGYILLGVFSISMFLKIVAYRKVNRFEQPVIIFLMTSFVMLFFYKNSLIDFYLLFLIPIIIIYFVFLLIKLKSQKIVFLVLFFLLIANLSRSPTFGNYDKTYLWVKKSVNLVNQVKNYCVSYNIFPQNYIESKLRYAMTQARNRPAYKECDLYMYYQCNPKVTTGYYFCENPVCQYKPVDLKRAELIDMNPLYSGVKIYKIQF